MITAAEWDAFLDDLQQTLDKFAVPKAEQAEIKAIVASTRADIVVLRRVPIRRGMTACGPTLPSWASTGHGSYLGSVRRTGEEDDRMI